VTDAPEPVSAPPAVELLPATPAAAQRPVPKGRNELTVPIVLAVIGSLMLIGVAGTLGLARSNASRSQSGELRPGGSAADSTPISSLTVEPLQVKIVARPAWRARLDGQTKFPREFDEAIKPYVAADYAAAADRMRELAARYPTAPEPLVYGGVSELIRGNAEQAADLLTRAAPLTREVFAEDIAWYLALAHRAQGKPAEMELRTLCAVGGDHGPQACAGVRELEARHRAAGEAAR
jgi:hypothetical protein